MKSTLRLFMHVLLTSLVVATTTVRAQSIEKEVDAVMEEKPFELGTYLGENRTINLMLLVRQAAGVTIRIKDADNTVLHELYLKKAPKAYHQKLNFDGSQAGTYQLEISDGRQTVTRRIDVVDVPAIESQRYITYRSL